MIKLAASATSQMSKEQGIACMTAGSGGRHGGCASPLLVLGQAALAADLIRQFVLEHLEQELARYLMCSLLPAIHEAMGLGSDLSCTVKFIEF